MINIVAVQGLGQPLPGMDGRRLILDAGNIGNRFLRSLILDIRKSAGNRQTQLRANGQVNPPVTPLRITSSMLTYCSDPSPAGSGP